MKHIKTFKSMLLEADNDQVIIEGPITRKELTNYTFHDDLTAFRPADQQYKALLKIADLPEGRIIIARVDTMIVGYVAFSYPHPLERWSEIKIKELIVLGAIEVIPAYRGARIASNLLSLSMEDKYMENYIVISTEYYWHWDLARTKLSIWEYRKVMEKIMATGGLTRSSTDDPEIISHPANSLMVRIGKHVAKEAIEQFNTLRFLNKLKYKTQKEQR